MSWGAFLLAKSAMLAADTLRPKAMCGRASEGRNSKVGTKPAAHWIQTALIPHSTSCWMTRLQAP